VQKVKAAAGLADEIVRPIPALQAVIVQAAAQGEGRWRAEGRRAGTGGLVSAGRRVSCWAGADVDSGRAGGEGAD